MTVSVPAPPDILSPEHAQDPYATYRILLEHYPVLYHAPTNSWLVSRHADLVALCSRQGERLVGELRAGSSSPCTGGRSCRWRAGSTRCTGAC